MQKDLTKLKCQPCRGDTPTLTPEEVARHLPSISQEWKVIDGKMLRKEFSWRNFLRSMFFVNAVAYLAEQEGHHPDITISYNRVTVELITHIIGGLSNNDFIMAAKIDRLVEDEGDR